MDTIGLDLHKRESQLCMLAPDGTATERRIITRRERFTAVLGGRAPAKVLLEASTESEWVARHLERLGHEVIVADPNYAPMYATRSRRVKTDKRDARTLAEACRLGAYRCAHRLSDARRHVRAELAVRDALVRTRTRYIFAIRTDNGVPFANTGLHGLTQLSVWWLRLGIQHQRIRPASPQENGAHERMHRTLKAATTRPPAANHVRQQHTFVAFQREYNHDRPHAALGGDPPATRYSPSPRAHPSTLPPLEYPGHYLVKRVTNAGTIRFNHKLLFLANALKQHHVGLEESADGVWSLYLGRVLLGKIDEQTMKVYG